MTSSMPPAKLLICIALLLWSYCFADQIVYLDRPSNPNGVIAEPYFNPQSITVNVGEQLHFVARFNDQSAFRDVLHHSRRMLTPYSLIHRLPGYLQSPITIHHVFITRVALL